MATASTFDKRGRVKGTVPFTVTSCVLIAAIAITVDASERRFTPVTDAMLRGPDAADWIDWRRTLDGWGDSPLKQIDTTDVRHLQLAWSWALGDGISQPTPLVHDGVMYLPSPNGLVFSAATARAPVNARQFRPKLERSLVRGEIPRIPGPGGQQ